MVIATRSNPAEVLVDKYGRRIRKLRISLTDACNLRCRYCMPEHAVFSSGESLMPPSEIERIARNLAGLGIDSIRLTGGEPVVRSEFLEVVERVCSIPGVRVGLTTNGFKLAGNASALAKAGLGGANVSLDSLDPDNFRRIARGGDLGSVLEGIFAARDAGLRVKINTVLMRGWNDHELEAFHDFSAEHGLEVRFLELMRIGEALAFFQERFVPASEMIERLQRRSPLREVPVDVDATAFERISDAGARLGFIASESRPFCGGCSRLRLSAKGSLRACLFKEDGLDLRGVPDEAIPDLVRKVVDLKPIGRIPSISQPMHAIGG